MPNIFVFSEGSIHKYFKKSLDTNAVGIKIISIQSSFQPHRAKKELFPEVDKWNILQLSFDDFVPDYVNFISNLDLSPFKSLFSLRSKDDLIKEEYEKTQWFIKNKITPCCFSPSHAEEIKSFALDNNMYYNSFGGKLLIHCYAGKSRSVAVAMALTTLFKKNKLQETARKEYKGCGEQFAGRNLEQIDFFNPNHQKTKIEHLGGKNVCVSALTCSPNLFVLDVMFKQLSLYPSPTVNINYQ